jgi:hypothetical protein
MKLEEVAFIVSLMEMTYSFDICINDYETFHDGEFTEKHLKDWNNIYLPSLKKPHSGDCTKECHTCIRCLTETWFKFAKKLLEELENKEVEK